MNINVKYCKKCGQAFDIETNLDFCWEHRKGESRDGREGFFKTKKRSRRLG